MNGLAGGDPDALASVLEVEGIGQIVAGEMANWFREPRNLAALNDLMQQIQVPDMEMRREVEGSPISARRWSSPGRW